MINTLLRKALGNAMLVKTHCNYAVNQDATHDKFQQLPLDAKDLLPGC